RMRAASDGPHRLVGQDVEAELRIAFDPRGIEEKPRRDADARWHAKAEEVLLRNPRHGRKRTAKTGAVLVVVAIAAISPVGAHGSYSRKDRSAPWYATLRWRVTEAKDAPQRTQGKNEERGGIFAR